MEHARHRSAGGWRGNASISPGQDCSTVRTPHLPGSYRNIENIGNARCWQF